MFETKEELVEYIMVREGIDHDCAEDFINQMCQDIIDCEGDIVQIAEVLFQSLWMDASLVCVSIMEV